MSLSLDHLLEVLQKESRKTPNPLRKRKLSPADMLQREVKAICMIAKMFYQVRKNDEDALTCLRALEAQEEQLQAAFESFLQSTSN